MSNRILLSFDLFQRLREQIPNNDRHRQIKQTQNVQTRLIVLMNDTMNAAFAPKRKQIETVETF